MAFHVDKVIDIAQWPYSEKVGELGLSNHWDGYFYPRFGKMAEEELDVTTAVLLVV